MTGRGGAHGDVQQMHPPAHSRRCSRYTLADLAWRAASEAGRFLLTERPDELSVESKSTPTDVDTSMDKAAEHLLFERLLGERPGDGLMGKGSDRASGNGDPLDC